MITDKPKFKNLKSEALKRVVEKLNNNDKITNTHLNVVDAVQYTHELLRKGTEQDEQINANDSLVSERITYASNKADIIKYHIITYRGEKMRSELMYKRLKSRKKNKPIHID